MTRQNHFLLRDFDIEGVFVSKIHNAMDILASDLRSTPSPATQFVRSKCYYWCHLTLPANDLRRGAKLLTKIWGLMSIILSSEFIRLTKTKELWQIHRTAPLSLQTWTKLSHTDQALPRTVVKTVIIYQTLIEESLKCIKERIQGHLPHKDISSFRRLRLSLMFECGRILCPRNSVGPSSGRITLKSYFMIMWHSATLRKIVA